ncbi:hypothetical protein KJ912_03155, partial [Patescibacteria group bacterium]|nr:hypothetical protein [Patescibacteria group bacterium]
MRARFWVIIFVGFSFFAGSFCEARAQKEEIEQDTIWDQDRVVDRTITIKQGVELKIKQGTRVRFEKEGSMNVQGDLTIAGEKEKPVIFYQEEDKQQDGERRAYYLFFGPDSNSKISHFIFRDAGGYFEGGSKMPGMRVKGQLEITDSLITENT